MQNNFLTTIRSLNLIEGCKTAQGYAFPSTTGNGAGPSGGDRGLRPAFSIRQKSLGCPQPPSRHHPSSSIMTDSPLPCGLPSLDMIEPKIDPYLRPVDPIPAFSDFYLRLTAAETNPEADLCDLYLEQHSLLRCVKEQKILRRALRSARVHALDVHRRIVISAWLRHERREDEFDPPPPPLAICSSTSPRLECPKATLCQDPAGSPLNRFCPCHQPNDFLPNGSSDPIQPRHREEGDTDGDLWFVIGEDEVLCVRSCIAALSMPLNTLLYGGFAEARRDRIDFTRNEISIRAMEALDLYSRIGRIDADQPAKIILELLTFSNKFCCEELKSTCDARLASLIRGPDDAMQFIEHGLEEMAHLLVGACLQCFLRGLPRILEDGDVARLLCSLKGKERLEASGHASFILYYFLSQVAMEENMESFTTIELLERLVECASPGWQKQQALHQLGCAMLEREEYTDAQHLFEKAAQEGHVYSRVGVARANFKRGHKYNAYKVMNSLLDEYEQTGWMYQERSLFCTGKEKIEDLKTATEMDPTLPYPYKYRAISLLEEDKLGAAIAEINKILGFKVLPDCLELRAWFSLVLEDYEGAMQDIRALMTLEPEYSLFNKKMQGDRFIEILRGYVQQWDMADCWMQLYDRWSAVDDVGSLAVVHQMLAREPGNSSLRFRESLLLLRLNCQKAAVHSLRLARNCSNNKYERLVYEGWILYDTGHREEALAKAEESIAIQRSFEAYFLKAYALGDSNLDPESGKRVAQLLEQAVSCQSDNLRKGQAYNNMGSIHVDSEDYEKAYECYVKALEIKHTRAHQGLARVYFVQNKKKRAYDEMTKLIEKAKSNASAYEKRSEYCEREMAKSDLNMATRLDPLRTYPYRYRAAVFMDDHKSEDALHEVSRALHFKLDLQLLYLRAAFNESLGHVTNSIRDCEAALCLEPAHGDTIELYNRVCGQRITESPEEN